MMSYLKMNDEQAAFFKNVLYMTLSSYVSHLNILADQWFVHAIEKNFLAAHIMITSLSLVCATIGRVLGQASLAVASNENSDSPLNTGTSLACVIAAFVFPLLLLTRPFVLDGFRSESGIENIYYAVFCLIFVIEIVKAPISMIMVRMGLQKVFLRQSLLSFSLNTIISAFAVTVPGLDQEARLISVAIASLTAALLVFVLSLIELKKCHYRFAWVMSWKPIRRLSRAIKGEAAYLMTLAALPFVTLRLLEIYYGASYVEGYGIAHRVIYLFSAPYFAGMILLVRERKDRQHSLDAVLKLSRPSFSLLCQLPLFVCGVAAIVLWGVSHWTVILTFAMLGLAIRSAVTIASRGSILAHRFRERSHFSGLAEIAASGMLGSLLLILLPRWLSLESAFLCSLLAPGAAYMGMMRMIDKLWLPLDLAGPKVAK